MRTLTVKQKNLLRDEQSTKINLAGVTAPRERGEVLEDETGQRRRWLKESFTQSSPLRSSDVVSKPKKNGILSVVVE